MSRLIVFFLCCCSGFLFSQKNIALDYEVLEYIQLHEDSDTASVSVGTVSNGSLKFGKLMPYIGANFMYFDRTSYLEGRAFLNDKAKKSVLMMYDSLAKLMPNRYFNLMECSNHKGGELFPHRTHQNGLSVDFMMPLIKAGKPYYELDTIGASHYALRFNNNGEYVSDTAVKIDFNLVAQQLLILNNCAHKVGLKIKKVIIKIELKDELYDTHYGQILKKSDIYIVRGLTPLINALHDDHFHVDFETI